MTCDHGGTATEYGPDRLTVTIAEAREAAARYVATGVRPTVVAWLADTSA